MSTSARRPNSRGPPLPVLAAVGVDGDRVAVHDAGVRVRVEHAPPCGSGGRAGRRRRRRAGRSARRGALSHDRVVGRRRCRCSRRTRTIAQARVVVAGRAAPASPAPSRCRRRGPRSRRRSARGSCSAPAPGRRAGHRSGTRSSPAASHPSSAVDAVRLSGWRSLPIPARPMLIAHLCRACGAPLTQTFVDLGATPLANSYLAPADAD